jgi:hypothetical protein|nr:MAG TPA: hypothetical protein [Caudoviricetes sp.]
MRKETAEQKEIRIFNIYKKDLEKLGKEHGQIRMNCIEYVCSFPKINPFKMAKTLKDDGYNILFDDSSISRAENEKKRRKVEKIA